MPAATQPDTATIVNPDKPAEGMEDKLGTVKIKYLAVKSAW